MEWVALAAVLTTVLTLLYLLMYQQKEMARKDKQINQMVNLAVFKAPMAVDHLQENGDNLPRYDDDTLRFIEELKKASQEQPYDEIT